MRELFIHPGWSKTGTSAIQKLLNEYFIQLKEKGILYSKNLQMIDNAHHKLALAFRPSGPYTSPINAQEAIDILREELAEHCCDSAILSSELSPIYLSHPLFLKFAKTNFDKISLIFTIRRQSDLLLSLFSQLVNDPMIRYKQTLFFLFLKNRGHLDFNGEISEWTSSGNVDEVIVLPYSKNIVPEFLNLFNLIGNQEPNSDNVHTSINSQYLLVLQHECKRAKTPSEFSKLKKKTLMRLRSQDFNLENNKLVSLFSIPEQRAVDQYFQDSNSELAERYLQHKHPFSSIYKEINAIPPLIFEGDRDFDVD